MKKRRGATDDGLGLIEVMIALTLMMFMMLGFQTLLNGSVKTYSQARLTTLGQQVGTDLLEQARRWPWDNLGTVNGSPKGNIADEQNLVVGSITFKVKTVIQDVLDPATLQSMNLRRVSVEVSRAGSTQTPVRLDTVIAAPKAQSIYNGVIGVTAHDVCMPASASDEIPNLLLSIDKGPSGPQTALTGANGLATFTQLVPTNVPAPVAGDYYQIGAADTSVYELMNDATLSPPVNQTPVNDYRPAYWNTAVQFSLDPGQVVKLPLFLYRRGSYTAHVRNWIGTEVNVPGTLTMTKTDTGLTYTAQTLTGTPATLTSITSTTGVVAPIKPCDAGEYGFTFTPRGQNPLSITTSTLGGAYPADTVVDGYVSLPAPVSQQIVVAYADGTPAKNATVRITGGGPTAITTAVVGTTDNNGRVWFFLNTNTNVYNITVDAQAPSTDAPTGWAAKSDTVTVTASAPTKNVTVAPPAPVSQPIVVKLADGTVVAGATVSTVSGGSPVSGTTDATGKVTLSMLASVTPYTLNVTAVAPSATLPQGSGAFSTTITVDPTPALKTITAPLPAAVNQTILLKFADNSPVVGAAVTVVVGSTPVTVTTDSAGQAVFSLQASVTPYAITVAGNPATPPAVLIGWAPAASTVTVTTTPTPKTITMVPA